MADKKIITNSFNINEFKNIIPLMSTNPILAKKKYEEYLSKYPKDYSAYTYYASILITLGYFKEAEEIFEYAKSTFKKNRNYVSKSHRLRNLISTKIRLLSYQEKYEELYQFCSQYYQEILNMNIASIHFYARKKTGQLLPELRENNSYLFRQITEYEENDFLDHVKKHLAEYNENIENPNSNLFVPGFKINEIVMEIKKHIPSDKRIFPDFFNDVYIFKYDNCGTVNNKPVNYFKVVCFYNTKDIITMCPVERTPNIPYIDLNYLNQTNEKETEPNTKVKRLSQTEKFNQRYNHL